MLKTIYQMYSLHFAPTDEMRDNVHLLSTAFLVSLVVFATYMCTVLLLYQQFPIGLSLWLIVGSTIFFCALGYMWDGVTAAFWHGVLSLLGKSISMKEVLALFWIAKTPFLFLLPGLVLLPAVFPAWFLLVFLWNFAYRMHLLHKWVDVPRLTLWGVAFAGCVCLVLLSLFSVWLGAMVALSVA